MTNTYQPKTVFGKPYTLEMALLAVGDGWSHLVKACYDICVENKLDIIDIKEKYGTLRFYTVTDTDDTFNQIEQICSKSSSICEYCGDEGKIRSIDGWYKTVCVSCYDKITNS